jgi:RimJ/RimL family protein N-acetyltransferase
MPLRLETERLILTPEDENDVEWFTELLNERGTQTFTVEDALQKITTMAAEIAARGIGALAVRRRSDAEPIGYCAIIVGRGSLAEPEIAYELLPRAHGQGYATEASRALLDAAFATGRTRICSTVGSWNAPSLRVLEKLGFRRDHSTTEADGELIWLVCDRSAPPEGPRDRADQRRVGPQHGQRPPGAERAREHGRRLP